MQEKEENPEIDDIKTTLDKIEQIPLFSNDGFDHNLVKRQTEDDEYEESDTVEDEADLTDEGRGWKKNGEKKKNKEKRIKKNKNKKKFKLKELSEEINEEKEEEDEDMNVKESISEEQEPAEPKIDPYTNGIQFSAYSGSPQPSYRPPPPRKEQGNKFLYSMDYQGNAQYMDEAAVSVLLRSPQAMKVVKPFFLSIPRTMHVWQFHKLQLKTEINFYSSRP